MSSTSRRHARLGRRRNGAKTAVEKEKEEDDTGKQMCPVCADSQSLLQLHGLDEKAGLRDFPHMACANCIDRNMDHVRAAPIDTRHGVRCLHCARAIDPMILRRAVIRATRKQTNGERAWRLFRIERILSGVSLMKGFVSCPKSLCVGSGWLAENNNNNMKEICCPVCRSDWRFLSSSSSASNPCLNRWRNCLSRVRIHLSSTPCPKCFAPVEKNGGCLHMRCSQCSYEFCWDCGQDYYKNLGRHANCDEWSSRRVNLNVLIAVVMVILGIFMTKILMDFFPLLIFFHHLKYVTLGVVMITQPFFTYGDRIQYFTWHSAMLILYILVLSHLLTTFASRITESFSPPSPSQNLFCPVVYPYNSTLI